ncbi:WXG100 family type VII secretion target [Micromonospora sp. HM5-17]|jgi:WXG100 family type VII secretion target|uniref:WXG100 family type VII secretion target n=1 Tax=Micromonospora sp. HM5-17 TaxID=2487710 RepID=UPI000F47660F|nr:WXG100 family type VII secretion target [Micromonospora sp. HM5-17]ROT33090.1 WXG100 family type VII secretion target [Micromonospora sp. HM5-17]
MQLLVDFASLEELQRNFLANINEVDALSKQLRSKIDALIAGGVWQGGSAISYDDMQADWDNAMKNVQLAKQAITKAINETSQLFQQAEAENMARITRAGQI